MPALTLGEAARLLGCGKSTFSRAIRAGKVSASRRLDASFEIEVSELARAYPDRLTPDGRVLAVHHGEPETPQLTQLEAEIARLTEVGELLRSQLGETRTDRDRWRELAERLALVRPAADPAQPWWRRLVG
jgi:hypothetical protein